MSAYIKIEGTKDEVASLKDMDELYVRRSSAREIDGDAEWYIKAYASAQAITDLQNQGLTVTVLVTDEETEALLASLDDIIGEDNTGIA